MEEMRGEREGGGLITKPQEITPIVRKCKNIIWMHICIYMYIPDGVVC